MPDDYVTLPPMKREQVEKLAALCEREGRPGSPGVSPFVAEILASAAPLLRTALEEPGEVRREYRVVQRRGEREIPRYLNSVGEPLDLEGCEGLADYMRSLGVSGVAVQYRAITETPWRDLEEGERDAAD